LHTFILRVVGDDARRRSLVMAMRERALDHGL